MKPVIYWPESKRQTRTCRNCGRLSRYVYLVKSELPDKRESWKDWPAEWLCDECIANEAVVGSIKHVFV